MAIPDRYIERIRSMHPSIEPAALLLNSEGMVNDVVIVNDELVFRFPKSERARELLAREARLLDAIAEHVRLPIPRPHRLEDDVVTYRLIHGEPLNRTIVSRLGPEHRAALLRELGEFLNDLHGIDVVSLDGIESTGGTRTRADWEDLHTLAVETLFPLLMRYQRDWITEHFTPVLDGSLDLSFEPALVHADLAPYHILFDDRSRRLTGVIDFGTAGIGDPAVDIGCLIYHYGESMVRQLAPWYPNLDTVLPRARFWAGTLEIQWAVAGIRHGDQSLLVAHMGSARDVGHRDPTPH